MIERFGVGFSYAGNTENTIVSNRAAIAKAAGLETTKNVPAQVIFVPFKKSGLTI